MCHYTIKQSDILIFLDNESNLSIPPPIKWFILSLRLLKGFETSRFNASIKMMEFASTMALLTSTLASARTTLPAYLLLVVDSDTCPQNALAYDKYASNIQSIHRD